MVVPLCFLTRIVIGAPIVLVLVPLLVVALIFTACVLKNEFKNAVINVTYFFDDDNLRYSLCRHKIQSTTGILRYKQRTKTTPISLYINCISTYIH